MPRDVIKLSVNLHKDVVGDIRDMAKGRSVTQTKVICDAIETEKLIIDAKKNGGKFLIEYPDGKITQVILR